MDFSAHSMCSCSVCPALSCLCLLVPVCLYPILGVFYIDMSLLSYGFGGVATYKVPTVIPWAGVEPLLSPKGWGSVATPPPKPHWGGADSHVIWPGGVSRPHAHEFQCACVAGSLHLLRLT